MKRGFSFIEIIMAIAIFTIVAGSSVTSLLGNFRIQTKTTDNSRAAAIANEGIEAVRSMRNNSWSSLVDGSHGLTDVGGTWQFSGTSDLVDGKYTRVINISPANRDGSGNLIATAGTTDSNAKLVTSTVTWTPTQGGPQSFELTTYVMNWLTFTGSAAGSVGATPTPTATPTATPTPTSCAQYCIDRAYTGSTGCKRMSQCSAPNFFIVESIGLCTGTSECCCTP